MLKRLTKEDVLIEVTREDEDLDPDGSFERSDDVADVRNQIELGNEWAWCYVTVTVRWGPFEASNSLGGCNYRNEADFREPGGEYDDMVSEAVDQLNDVVNEAAALLETLKAGVE